MYKITVQTLTGNEHTIYFPGSEEYTVTSAILSLKVGNAGTFEFTVPFNNPLYNEIVDHSIITVYEDEHEIWRGDIQDYRQNFDKSLNVYCVEDLAWLGEEAVAMTAITNQTYGQRFSAAIAGYNANQVAKRQFAVGVLTSVTTTNLCNWKPQYEENLLDCLRHYIADDGYVRIRRAYTGNVLTRYVDIVKLSDFGQQASQKIEFGSNLLDFVKEMDNTNFLNVLYPYGAETETELYGDIMQRIVGTPIQNDASVAAFGRRARSVIFETESEAKLNSLALAYLNRYSQPSMKLEVKAVDLGNIEVVNRIHLGDSVRVIATIFGIDQWDYVTNQELDLLNIANNQITLADAIRTNSLTSQVIEQAKDIEDIRTPASVLDEAKRNAWAIFEGENGGIVTFDINGNEQIVGIHIANNLDLDQATKAWGWNINGLVYLHREYPTDDWTVGIAMTMDGAIVADYITTGTLSADRINGGHIRANLITALNDGTTVGSGSTTLGDLATKASTIVDVDVEYAKNQSSTTAPTTGWSTSSPQWEEGYYIWQRTKTVDGNNTASYSTPVCIQGADGQQGPTGKGVSAIVEQYYLSTSNVSPTGGSWQNTQPTWEHGKYIWTRSEITWTDTTVTTTTPVLAETANQANESVYQLDADLDQDGVFNRLIGGDTAQGIVLINGKLYLRGEYLTAGEILVGGSAYANNPTLAIKDTLNNTIGYWTKDGIYSVAGHIGSVYIDSASLYISGYREIYTEYAAIKKGYDRIIKINPTDLGITISFNLRIRINISSSFTYSDYGRLVYWTDSSSLPSSEIIDSATFETVIFCTSNQITYLEFDLNPNKRSAISSAEIIVDTNLQKKTNIAADFIAGDFKGTLKGIALLNDINIDDVIYARHQSSGRVSGLRIKSPSYYRYSDFTPAVVNLQDEDDDTYLRMEGTNTPNVTRYYSSTTEVARWQSSSDERVKEDIKPLDVQISKNIIDYSKPKSFKFKNKQGKHYGMIAQDARELLDSLGETDARLEFSQGNLDVEDQRAIDYEEYIPHLINYVKDLRAEISALKNIIKKEEEN